MRNIAWEKTVDGKQASLVQRRAYVQRASFLVKVLAKMKMTDVTLISADFDTHSAVFETRINLYLDWSTHSEFLGVYQREDEKDGQDVPNFCIINAHWYINQDFQQFN